MDIETINVTRACSEKLKYPKEEIRKIETRFMCNPGVSLLEFPPKFL